MVLGIHMQFAALQLSPACQLGGMLQTAAATGSPFWKCKIDQRCFDGKIAGASLTEHPPRRQEGNQDDQHAMRIRIGTGYSLTSLVLETKHANSPSLSLCACAFLLSKLSPEPPRPDTYSNILHFFNTITMLCPLPVVKDCLLQCLLHRLLLQGRETSWGSLCYMVSFRVLRVCLCRASRWLNFQALPNEDLAIIRTPSGRSVAPRFPTIFRASVVLDVSVAATAKFALWPGETFLQHALSSKVPQLFVE